MKRLLSNVMSSVLAAVGLSLAASPVDASPRLADRVLRAQAEMAASAVSNDAQGQQTPGERGAGKLGKVLAQYWNNWPNWRNGWSNGWANW